MDGIFPFEDFEIEKNTSIIAFAPNPTIPILACLTCDSVSIRDSLSYSIKQITEIKRSQESLHEYGPNTWVQWFDQENIAFGTSSGRIFISKLTNNSFNKIQEVNISRIISTTFVAFNCVGIFTTQSDLFFINIDGSIKYQAKISDEASIIRYATFSPPSTITCIINGTPSFLSLDLSSFQKNFKPLIKSIPINNIHLTSYSSKRNLICVEENNKILLINCSPKKIAPFELYKSPRRIPIIYMEWVIHDNYLILINEEGEIIIYYDNYSIYKVTFPNVKKGFIFCYEPNTNRIIYKDQESIRFIGFIKVKSQFIFSAHQVIDAILSKTVFNSKSGFYPITNVSYHSDLDILLISTPNQFLVIYKDKTISKIIEINIQNINIFNEFIVIFSKDIITIFDIYELNIILKTNFHYSPETISVFDKQMIVTNPYHYTIIQLFEDEIKKDLLKCGKYYISFNHKHSNEKIRNAFYYDNESPIIYYDDGDIYNIKLKQFICTDVIYAFQFDSPPIIFMRSENFIYINIKSLIMKLQCNGILTNGNILFSPKELEFGKFALDPYRFGCYILINSLNEKETLELLLNSYRKKEYFKYVLFETFHLSFVYNITQNVINFLDEYVQPGLIAETFVNVLPNLKKENLNLFYNEIKINWDKIYPLIPKKFRTNFLINLNYKTFLSLVDNHPKFIDDEELIIKCIVEKKFIRCFVFTYNKSINFFSYFNENSVTIKFDLKEAIELFENEFVEWENFDGITKILNFFGSSLQIVNYNILSLSIFLIIKDQNKVNSILLVDDDLLQEAMNYIKINNYKYSKILQIALKNNL